MERIKRITRRQFLEKSGRFLAGVLAAPQLSKQEDGLLCKGNVDELINCAASYMGIGENYAHEIVDCESKHDPGAFNRSSGASGLWQITPINSHYFREQGWVYPADAFDPEKSTTVAIMIFRRQGLRAWSCS